MKLVKYCTGTTDLACPEKEVPAIIVGESEVTSKHKVTDENPEGKFKVADLVIFVNNSQMINRRESVPHVSNKLVGKDGKTVHPYYEEYEKDKLAPPTPPAPKPKAEKPKAEESSKPPAQ